MTPTTFGALVTISYKFDLPIAGTAEQWANTARAALLRGNSSFPLVTISGDIARVFVRGFVVGGIPLVLSQHEGPAGLHLAQFAAALSSPLFKADGWPVTIPAIGATLILENHGDTRAKVSVSFAMEPSL